MDERIIPFIIFFKIIVGWIYIPGLYRNLLGREQRVNAYEQGNYRSIHSEEYQNKYKKKKYEYY